MAQEVDRSSELRKRSTSVLRLRIVLLINDSPAHSSTCDSFESPAIFTLSIISLPIAPMLIYADSI